MRASSQAVFVAALSLVLHYYTRKQRVAIWATFPNRVQAGTEKSVGVFANTHLIGADLSADEPCCRLIEQIRDTILAADYHQEMPLAYLWKALRCVPRSQGANVFFEFRGAKAPRPDAKRDGPVFSVLFERPPKLWSGLGVYVGDTTREFQILSQYNATRFPRRAVDRMLADVREILAQLVEHPSVPISGLAGRVAQYCTDGTPETDSAMSEFLVLGGGLIPEAQYATGSPQGR